VEPRIYIYPSQSGAKDNSSDLSLGDLSLSNLALTFILLRSGKDNFDIFIFS